MELPWIINPAVVILYWTICSAICWKRTISFVHVVRHKYWVTNNDLEQYAVPMSYYFSCNHHLNNLNVMWWIKSITWCHPGPDRRKDASLDAAPCCLVRFFVGRSGAHLSGCVQQVFWAGQWPVRGVQSRMDTTHPLLCRSVYRGLFTNDVSHETGRAVMYICVCFRHWWMWHRAEYLPSKQLLHQYRRFLQVQR